MKRSELTDTDRALIDLARISHRSIGFLSRFRSGFFVYRVFAEAGELLYVGQTNNVLARLGQHARNAPWWCFAGEVTWREYESREAALGAEASAIRRERPTWNVGAPVRFPKVTDTAAVLDARARAEHRRMGLGDRL